MGCAFRRGMQLSGLRLPYILQTGVCICDTSKGPACESSAVRSTASRRRVTGGSGRTSSAGHGRHSPSSLQRKSPATSTPGTGTARRKSDALDPSGADARTARASMRANGDGAVCRRELRDMIRVVQAQLEQLLSEGRCWRSARDGLSSSSNSLAANSPRCTTRVSLRAFYDSALATDTLLVQPCVISPTFAPSRIPRHSSASTASATPSDVC